MYLITLRPAPKSDTVDVTVHCKLIKGKPTGAINEAIKAFKDYYPGLNPSFVRYKWERYVNWWPGQGWIERPLIETKA